MVLLRRHRDNGEHARHAPAARGGGRTARLHAPLLPGGGAPSAQRGIPAALAAAGRRVVSAIVSSPHTSSADASGGPVCGRTAEDAALDAALAALAAALAALPPPARPAAHGGGRSRAPGAASAARLVPARAGGGQCVTGSGIGPHGEGAGATNDGEDMTAAGTDSAGAAAGSGGNASGAGGGEEGTAAELQLCQICFVAPREYGFVHVDGGGVCAGVCGGCVARLRERASAAGRAAGAGALKCPFCRQQVDLVVRVFMV